MTKAFTPRFTAPSVPMRSCTSVAPVVVSVVLPKFMLWTTMCELALANVTSGTLSRTELMNHM